ncbi:hypothetical protein [Paenibacillus hamazuiensis]|uniref:hypothetical protein n=1 Tax=Paenibacillus hamazuiensis TaxID=2936508 RepID=UPI00200F49E7|nr:hypothetical protein [Paenibacillus hamazuiensis]
MSRYFKLLHYELFRVRKIYLALFAVILILQLAGMYLYAHSYLSMAGETMRAESLSAAQYIAKYRPTSFYSYTVNSALFSGAIALAASVLLIYVFLIWYRDWLGKNMFIYRLLMIPASRMSVYLAKLSAILLMVLGLVAFELLVVPVQNAAFNALVPSELRYSNTVADIVASHTYLQIVMPVRFVDFIVYYAAGAAGVVIIFTAILIERCFRIKGAVGAIAYGAIAVVVFILPVFMAEELFPAHFYPQEIVWMEAALGTLIACGSLALSAYLLKNKVTV